MKKILLALKRVGLVLIWFIVILLSIALLTITIPITIPLFIYKSFNKKNVGQGLDSISQDLRNIAYTIDLVGNVTLFDWIDILPNKYPYGIPKQPISFVLYNRINNNCLTKIDIFVINIILLFDKNHFNKENYNEYLKN